MDYFFEILGIALALLGIVGSFVPILPGPITGWAGILVIQLSDRVTIGNAVIIGTFFLALFIFLLDYVIPILGTKKFCGSRMGAIGATLGLVLGLLFLGPIGLIIGPFAGAFFGELLHGSNQRLAFRAALGSFLGFVSGVLLKFIIAVGFLAYICTVYFQQVIG